MCFEPFNTGTSMQSRDQFDENNPREKRSSKALDEINAVLKELEITNMLDVALI
jgi:hypothetical protein